MEKTMIKEKEGKAGNVLADVSYNGLFLRSLTNQLNIIPKNGFLNTSPDIIPTGTTALADPVSMLRDTYTQDIGKNLVAGKSNFIYIRSKNYSNSRISDNTDGNRPRLFWTKASLLSYPGSWTEIKDNGNNRPASLVADAGAIGVIDAPFTWIPANISNNNYNLIGLLPSPGYDNSIPMTPIISDFAAWVALHGGVAWRNLATFNANTLNINFTVDYDQGDEPGVILMSIVCKNVPLGTIISFSAGTPGPNPPFNLPPTPVATYPSFIAGVQSNVPAGYKTNIYVNAQAPPGNPDFNNASITLQASYVAPPGDKLFQLGHTLQELGVPTSEHMYGMISRQHEKDGKSSSQMGDHAMYLEALSNLNTRIGPSRMIVVGAYTVRWDNN